MGGSHIIGLKGEQVYSSNVSLGEIIHLASLCEKYRVRVGRG